MAQHRPRNARGYDAVPSSSILECLPATRRCVCFGALGNRLGFSSSERSTIWRKLIKNQNPKNGFTIVFITLLQHDSELFFCFERMHVYFKISGNIPCSLSSHLYSLIKVSSSWFEEISMTYITVRYVSIFPTSHCLSSDLQHLLAQSHKSELL